MSRRPAAATPAFAVLDAAAVQYTAHSYEHDPRADSYGLEAAEALDVDPARVFKTLLVDLGETLAVGVVPVTGRLDLKGVARALGAKKAQLADPAVAERATGYVVGGISPLGQRRRLPTVVDASASDWETILVSAGRRGLEVELSPVDLVRLTAATLSPVAG